MCIFKINCIFYIILKNNYNELDNIIPDILTYIDLCKENDKESAVLNELYKMVPYLDLHDEVGKRSLIQLLKSNLESVDNGDDVYRIMDGLKILFQNDLEYVREIVPLISDIITPILQSDLGEPEELLKEIENLRMQVPTPENLDRISVLTEKLATFNETV